MFAYCLNNPVRYEDSQCNIAYDNVDEDANNDENVFNDTARIGNQSYKSFQLNDSNVNIERSFTLPDGKGFSNFNQLKTYLGPAGNRYHWHHIVEQCQIGRSGFSPEQIHNTSNVIPVEQSTHAKITGHYNTTTFPFTNGMSVRNWLTGQPFAVQYEYGINVLYQFGVIR